MNQIIILLTIGMTTFLPTTSAAAQSAQKLSLDTGWTFKADPQKIGLGQKWHDPSVVRTGWAVVPVPRFWEEYRGLETYDGWGWYAVRFDLQSNSEPMSLHFEGVDDEATVWLNGTQIGDHTGYSDPFTFDLGTAAHPGANLLVIQVRDNGGGGGIYKPVTIVPTARLGEFVRSPYAGMHARPSAQWVSDAVIYSAYLRSSSPEGSFAGLEKRLPELKAMGVTVIWLMPIHPVGLKNRKGTLGSPYAVQDYYGINPEFGTMADFRHLLTAVHKQEMKLIIDLVANHTSWDNRLITEHPDWFTRDSSGTMLPPNRDWTDVADLDYSRQGLREYMWKMMDWWVKDVGIDGFRCDVAEMVPTDFWNEARRRLDRIKPVMMLSEGSIPEHHLEAFDLTYSWNIYDVLSPLLKGTVQATSLEALLRNERLHYPEGTLRLRFNTNHDKNAWDAPALEKYGPEGVRLTAALVSTIPGIPLVYTGEEVANDRRLSLFEKTEVDWSRPREMEQFYKSLFALRREHAALREGSMATVKNNQERSIYSFLRAGGNDTLLVVLNFARQRISVVLSLPPSLEAGRLSRVLGNGSVGERGENNLTVDLPPFGFAILSRR